MHSNNFFACFAIEKAAIHNPWSLYIFILQALFSTDAVTTLNISLKNIV